MINKLIKSCFEPFREFARILNLGQVKIGDFSLAAIVGVLAALTEGLTYKLLVPAVNSFLKLGSVSTSIETEIPDTGEEGLGLLVAVSLVILCAVLRIILQYFSSLLLLKQVRKFGHNLRQRVFNRYLQFGKVFFDRANSGELYQILMGYTQDVALFLNGLNQALFRFFVIVVYLCLLFFLSPLLFAVVIIVLPLLYLLVNILISKVKSLSFGYIQVYSSMSRWVSDVLDNFLLIRLNLRKEKEQESFRKLSFDLQQLQFEMDRIRLVVSPVQEALVLLLVFLIAYCLSVYVGGKGSLALANIVVFMLVLRRMAGSMGFIGDLHGAYAQIKGPLSVLDEVFCDNNKNIVTDGNISCESFQDKIEFANLSFAYEENNVVLSQVNFTVKKNEVIGIVGTSGSGKSTLLQLLLGFYQPSQGCILVDSIDLASITKDSWYRNISIINQQVLLFNQTLRYNLVYGLDIAPDDKELWQLLELVGMKGRCESATNGLDSIVGEHGVNFSGGERQRLAIVRAILRDTPIILIDEATSALDKETEAIVQKVLKERFVNKTVLIIAHKLSALTEVNRLVVFDEGKIIADGPRDMVIGDSKFKNLLYMENQE